MFIMPQQTLATYLNYHITTYAFCTTHLDLNEPAAYIKLHNLYCVAWPPILQQNVQCILATIAVSCYDLYVLNNLHMTCVELSYL